MVFCHIITVHLRNWGHDLSTR